MRAAWRRRRRRPDIAGFREGQCGRGGLRFSTVQTGDLAPLCLGEIIFHLAF